MDLLEAGLDEDLSWPAASWFILGGFDVLLIVGFVLITELWISPRKDSTKFNPQGAAVTSMMGFTAAWHKARQVYRPSITKKTAEAFIALAVYTNASKKVPLYPARRQPLGLYPGPRRQYLQHRGAMVLGVPGPVLTTSTKPDVVAWTVTARQAQGEVFVCDWEDITGWPNKVKWTPI